MEGGESHELMLMRRALDNYSRFVEHQYLNFGKSLTAELQQIGEDLAALVETTAIDSGHENIERRHKLFYRGKIDRGQGGNETALASVGGIIVDLQDNVVSRFSYMVPAQYITNKILFEYVCFIRAIKHAAEEAVTLDLIVYGDSRFITIITATQNCVRRRLLPMFVKLGHLHLHSQASSHMMKFHGLSYYWVSCHGSHMNRAAEEATEAIIRQRMNRDENHVMTELCTVCFKDVDNADMTYVPDCFHLFCNACALVNPLPYNYPVCPCKGCPSNLPFQTPALYCHNCGNALPVSPPPNNCPSCWVPVTLFFAGLPNSLLNSFV